MKVRTTNASTQHNIAIKEFSRIMPEGVEFEVDEERFEVLAGKNQFNVIFVEAVKEEIPKTEEATTEETPKTKKKRTKVEN